jgi:hypothetical protein
MLSSPCPICSHPCSIADTSCPECGYSFETKTQQTISTKAATTISEPRLRPCPDCGHSCSTLALSCPNCGRPFQSPAQGRGSESVENFTALESAGKKNINIGIIAVVCLFLIVAGALFYTFLRNANNAQPLSQSNRNSQSSQSNRNNQLSPRAITATQEAISALRRLDAATQVGVSFFNYNPLLIDAQAKVNEALPLLPNGNLKNEISLAMEAYNDAYLAWRITNQQGFLISPPPAGLIDGSQLIQKYSLPPSPLSGTSIYVTREDALSTIWTRARQNIDRASSLLNH